MLAARGRRVPEDVAVVGYDDLGVAERTDPPLTTVRQPATEMATRATVLLLDQLRTGSPVTVRHEIVPPVLVRRRSA